MEWLADRWFTGECHRTLCLTWPGREEHWPVYLEAYILWGTYPLVCPPPGTPKNARGPWRLHMGVQLGTLRDNLRLGLEVKLRRGGLWATVLRHHGRWWYGCSLGIGELVAVVIRGLDPSTHTRVHWRWVPARWVGDGREL